jgi:hypothetical protein
LPVPVSVPVLVLVLVLLRAANSGLELPHTHCAYTNIYPDDSYAKKHRPTSAQRQFNEDLFGGISIPGKSGRCT